MKKLFEASLIVLIFIAIISIFFNFSQSRANGKIIQNTNESNKLTSNIIAPNTSTTQPVVRVPILVYHSVRPYFAGESNSIKKYDVDPNNFKLQLQYLKSHGYTAVSFDKLVKYFDGVPLPKKPVIISFDDGWENQFTNAFPILKDEKITATFYIYTNAIGKKNYFSWEQVQELSNAGMEIGDHSKSHPFLWKITDQKLLQIEIADSKKTIEDHIGKTITTFAYPFGLYKPITIDAVKAAGYTSARTGFERTTHSKDDLFILHSFEVSNNMKMFVGNLEHLK